ncbi:MAG: hypothetical protein FWG44_01740 [Oscillospiraceae bacterium]|nr:hypothetical protein [Oscillospiraceae bacterium]
MNSNKPAFIATVVVFLLAVAAAIFAFWKIAEEEETAEQEQMNTNSTYKPSAEAEQEMRAAATRLIENNHKIITLYISDGLEPKKEPYANAEKPLGNPPEDHLYYVVASDDYETLTDIESIVDDTFPPEEAARVKDNDNNGTPYYSGFGRIYNSKADGELGINARFAEYMYPPQERPVYPIKWTDTPYVIAPLSATECVLTVTVEINGRETKIERKMLKLNGHWYLDKLIHEDTGVLNPSSPGNEAAEASADIISDSDFEDE